MADPADIHVEQITDQMADDACYRSSHESRADVMRQGGRQDVTVNLRSAVNYRILSVCDNDCRDPYLGLSALENYAQSAIRFNGLGDPILLALL